MEFEYNWNVPYFDERVQEIDGNIMTSIMTSIFRRKQTSSKFDSMIYPIVWLLVCDNLPP